MVCDGIILGTRAELSIFVAVQNGESGGVFFAFCYNLTSYNATFYYDFSVNPWYQATVDSISADQLTWNITVGALPYPCRT